jgi:DNA-binding NarL/FixJ family response regulator
MTLPLVGRFAGRHSADRAESVLKSYGYSSNGIPTHPTIPPGFVLTTSVTVYSGPLLTDSDGVTLTRQLKSLPQFAHIPIILMTGDSRRQTLFSSMQAGAVDFVARSFTRDVVRARLEKVLRLGTVPDPA